MSCSGLANVLSGVAAIWRPRQGRPSADHTAIGASHHGISLGTITVASANDRHPQIPWLIPRRAAVGAKASSSRTPAMVGLSALQPSRAHARPAPSPSTASRITFGRPPRSSQPARPPGPAPICGSLWPPRLDQGRGSFSQPGAWDREAASGSTGGHEAPILSTGSKKVGVARSFRRGRARNNRDSDTPPAREFSWVRDLIENPVGMADKVVEKGLSGQVGGEARVSAPIVTFC